MMIAGGIGLPVNLLLYSAVVLLAQSNDESRVLAGAMMLSYAAASAISIWVGYNMLKLRSYWMAVAGSFTVMPGGFGCCLAGMPVGIWSLCVLSNPEVRAAFD